MELPTNVRNRLVLENCEHSFSIKDCILINDQVGVPIVFDTHHYECYKQLHPNEKFEPADYYIGYILQSWHKRGIKPKFHVSEQGSGRCGHHSDFIETIPDYLLNIPDLYATDIDIMIEAKMKEQAIFKLYVKYPFLSCKKSDTNIEWNPGETIVERRKREHDEALEVLNWNIFILSITDVILIRTHQW